MAARQVLLGETCKHDAVELHDVVAEMFENAAHDAVAAGVQLDADALFGVVVFVVGDFVGSDEAIVKLDAKFFDRWGVKLHTATLENAQHVEGEPNKLVLWDGKYKGKVVENGVYYLNLEALGSDGRKYKIKKAINVLKGFREGSEESGSSGGSGGGGGGVSI